MEIGWLTNPIDFVHYLYHYTSTQKAIEYILEEKTFKFSHIKHTNDPLEYNDLGFHIITNSDQILNESLRFAKDANRNIRKNTNIACFSIDSIPPRNPNGSYCEDTFYKGYSRSRMWSQYANDHKGCCFVFNQNKLIDIVLKSIDCNLYEVITGEIEYSNDTTDYEEMMTIRTHKLKDDDYYLLKLEKWKRLLFRKLSDYRDEQEFRIAIIPRLINSNDVNELYIRYEDSLEAIIIGDRFPKAYEVNIKEYAKTNKINIFKISWGQGKPIISYFFRFKDE